MFLQKENSRGVMIALKIPQDIANQLIIKGGETPEDLHITICYIKDATEMQVAGMLYIANLLAKQFSPRVVGLKGSGVFELDNDAKVLYLTVDASTVEPLHNFVYRSLYNMEVAYPDNTGYMPHVSLKYFEGNETIEHVNLPLKEFKAWQVMFTYGGNELLIPFAMEDSMMDLSSIVPTSDVLQLSHDDISNSAREAAIEWNKNTQTKNNGMYYQLSKPSQKLSTNDVMAFPSHELIDMNGNVFKFDKTDVHTYLQNTTARINSKHHKNGGGVVGLPVDMKGHADGDSAAWIKSVELSSTIVDGEEVPVITGKFEWTSVGETKVRDNLVKYFSPTIDTVNKVIYGGSLTNWPGTVDRKGQPIMNPLMLQSQKVRKPMSDDKQKVDDVATLSQEDIASQIAKAVMLQLSSPAQPVNADNSDGQPSNILAMLGMGDVMAGFGEVFQQAIVAELDANRKQLESKMQEQMATMMKGRVIVELSRGLTAGHPVNGKVIKHILPVSQADLTAFLTSLNTQQFKVAQTIFMNLGLVGTSPVVEEGYNGQEDKPTLLDLPVAAKIALSKGMTIDKVFNQAAHFKLESKDKYNLEGYK